MKELFESTVRTVRQAMESQFTGTIEWHAGRWWDLFIIALYRSDFWRTGKALVDKLGRSIPVAS